MFIISKSVAAGLKALREREDVARELAAIHAMPGFEVYANAIADGVADGPARKGKPRQEKDEAADDGEG